MRLPLCVAAVDTPPPPPAAPAADVRGPAGCRVFLVDDNADARETLGALLEMFGYEVMMAGDAREALLRPAIGPRVPCPPASTGTWSSRCSSTSCSLLGERQREAAK